MAGLEKPRTKSFSPHKRTKAKSQARTIILQSASSDFLSLPYFPLDV
jgi:hypothetical protein